MMSKLVVGGTLCALLFASEPAFSQNQEYKQEKVQDISEKTDTFYSYLGNYTIGVRLHAGPELFSESKWKYTMQNYKSAIFQIDFFDSWTDDLSTLNIIWRPKSSSLDKSFKEFKKTFEKSIYDQLTEANPGANIKTKNMKKKVMTIDDVEAICNDYIYDMTGITENRDTLNVKFKAKIVAVDEKDKLFYILMTRPILITLNREEFGKEYIAETEMLFEKILNTFNYKNTEK